MELIELIKYVCESLKDNYGINISDKIVLNVLLAISVIAIFVISWRVIVVVYRGIKEKIQDTWRKETIENILSPDYLDQLKEHEFFIQTRFTTTQPHNYDDPLELETRESAKGLIDFFIDNVLTKNNTSTKLYCILAGPGMGKTTWAVNMVIAYIQKYTKRNCPYEIKLLSLARKNFEDDIKSIAIPNKTILILDALDENVEAGVDIRSFMLKLEEVVEKFRFVVITSRTQFFSEEAEEPYHSSIMNLSGKKGHCTYQKLYLSPFTQDDIDKYLKKKYSWRKLRKARQIVSKCQSLTTRPLLLSNLDYLMDKQIEYTSLTTIYETLIDSWLKREVRFANPTDTQALYNRLNEFSIKFALTLLENKAQSTNMRLPKEEYMAFLDKYSFKDYNFSGRSLINRDSIGSVKFSHKTFYEFFLAKAKVEEPDLEIPLSGYELAWEFYRETVSKRLKEASIKCSTLQPGSFSKMEIEINEENAFNFVLLRGVMDISRVYINAKLLSNESFVSWIQSVGVEEILIGNHTNEPLSMLASIPRLQVVQIYHVSKGGTLPRGWIRKLQYKGVHVWAFESSSYIRHEALKKDMLLLRGRLPSGRVFRMTPSGAIAII